MNDSSADIKVIFADALERTTAQERADYLDVACSGDARLREKVESLLKAHAEASDVPNAPIVGPELVTQDTAVTEGPGTVIGRYKLLEKVGEGGMAVVYMAEQQRPLRRRVALKIIKLGMDTKQVIARFEAERQALAMMDHPNIAKVFDAGTTGTGRPYFVMELVRGVSITDYCDKKLLNTRERLDLFLQVCDAVQHAHQKGTIHRDIKPSNVMVTLHEGKPLPLVIDFGIAKAISQRLTEKTLFTRYAQMIGTPEYMSPEQAEMSRLDVDTRTDIYSLGVLLYELLTGTLPFEPKRLLEAGYAEIQRIIREEEPDKPSTRLSTVGESLTEIARHRKVSPDSLTRLIRGDLDWIVMKSLEKNPGRRYGTAIELASDIQRHLSSEPVSAGPPSVCYRTKKYVQRHRTLVAAAAAVVMTLIAGLVVSTSLYVRMRRANHAVSQLENKVDIDRKLSEVQKLHTQGRHLAALEEIESMLAEQDLGPRAHLLQAQLLVELGRRSEAEAKLTPLTQADPEIAAVAHYLLARVNIGVDEAKAREHEARAESLLPKTAEAYVLRAMTALDAEETLQWLNRAIALDPSHYSARKARALFHYRRVDDEQAIEDVSVLIALRPEDSLGYALRAVLRRETGQLEEALADHNRAIELGENASETAEVYDQRYRTYVQMGDYTSALEDARRLAESHPQDMGHRLNIVMCSLVLGDYATVQQEHRAIVQASHFWDRFARRYLAYQVLAFLKAGLTLNIPGEIAQKTPFATIQRTIECYEVLEANARRLPTKREGLMVLAWSPDGKQLLCGWAGTEGAMRQTIRNTIPSVADRVGLKIIDIESGEERHLPGSFHGFKAWSPDGKYIASADADNNLCIVPVEGGQPRILVYGDSPSWWPQWSEDPKRLYFKQPWPGGKLCSIGIDDPDPAPAELIECPGCFAVCETGDWVAYEEPTGVSMFDLSSGSLLYRCPSPWPLRGWGLRPSPSGRELFFASWWSYIHTGPIVLDTKEKQLYQVLDYPVDQLLWSPDGSKLAIGAAREIWIMDLDPNVPISQILGQKIPGNDLARYWLQRHTQAIAAAPSHPENYLERALAYMSLDEYQEAESDLRQFDILVTSDDHHVGHELFWWLRQCYFNGMYREAELLTPHAERVMERFSANIPSYRDLIEQIVERTEGEGKTELSKSWRAKLHGPTDRGK